MPDEDSAPLVSLEVVKSLLAVQEGVFRTMVEVMLNISSANPNVA